MPATLYSSTDSGAPVLSLTAGSLITVLDAILVSGYGIKSPAGWTKEFTGTSKAVYRNGTSSEARTFFRVDDSATNYASILGYNSMTNVDNGTYRIPNSTSYNLYLGKSTRSGSPKWIALADSRTLYLHVYAGSMASSLYLGDGVSSYGAGDVGNCLMNAGKDAGSTTGSFYHPIIHSVSAWPTNLGFWRKSNAGAALAATPLSRGLAGQGLQTTADNNDAPNNEYGFLDISQPSGQLMAHRLHYYYYDTTSATRTYGGRFRWLVAFAHYSSSLTELNDYTGVGELSGTTIKYLGPVNGYSNSKIAMGWDMNDP